MEMHAITVKWEADDKVTLYEKTQFLAGTQGSIAAAFGIPPANVRVITKFVGGAFGSAGGTWATLHSGSYCSKANPQANKVSLTRDQMFTMVGYRRRNVLYCFEISDHCEIWSLLTKLLLAWGFALLHYLPLWSVAMFHLHFQKPPRRTLL
jgi:xanthine dehydrogenase molybdopterin-binding subunit B